MLEKCTKTSSPCSREMKPNPFSALKNLTVPCATNTQFSLRRTDLFDSIAAGTLVDPVCVKSLLSIFSSLAHRHGTKASSTHSSRRTATNIDSMGPTTTVPQLPDPVGPVTRCRNLVHRNLRRCGTHTGGDCGDVRGRKRVLEILPLKVHTECCFTIHERVIHGVSLADHVNTKAFRQ